MCDSKGVIYKGRKNIDQFKSAFAVTIKRMSSEEDSKFSHYYLLGSGITLWLTWQASTLTGILLEKTIPEELNLGFAIPLVFLALIAPDVIKYKSHAICALSAGTFAIIFHNLPLNLWIILSAVIGLLVGAIINKIDTPITLDGQLDEESDADAIQFFGNPKILAAFAALLVTVITRNIAITITTGMVVLWILTL